MRFLHVLVLGLGLAASAVMAADECIHYQWTNDGYADQRGAGWFAEPIQACNQAAGWYRSQFTGSGAEGVTVQDHDAGGCVLKRSNGALYNVSLLTKKVPCPEDECAASSTPNVKNVTVGYVRSRGDSDGVVTFNPGAPGQTACDGKCTVKFGAIESVWESQGKASNGMYRVSYDIQTFKAGGACNAVDDALDSTPENVKPCDGTLGEVNGKPYCAKPPNGSTSLPAPPMPTSDGNPTAGSGPTPGTDRTPNTGGGGPEGGPRGGTNPSGTVVLPGTGGGASGTVTKPGEGKEQANCGAPGQPKCSINEEGTPSANDGKALFDGPLKALEQVSTDAKKAFDEAKNLKAEPWTFTFQLPTGCTDLSFDWGAFGGIIKVDVCKHQALIHSLMSFLWICAGIGGSFILLQRTVAG